VGYQLHHLRRVRARSARYLIGSGGAWGGTPHIKLKYPPQNKTHIHVKYTLNQNKGKNSMYLQHIVMQNIGPIAGVSIEMPFNTDDTPQPLVLVGENGSGKTKVLVSIVNALATYANRLFRVEEKTFYEPISLSVRFGEVYGFLAMRFCDTNQAPLFDVFNFMLNNRYQGSLQGTFPIEHAENILKTIHNKISIPNFNICLQNHEILRPEYGLYEWHGDQKENAKKDWRGNVHCYFPSDRFEDPRWRNTHINLFSINQSNEDHHSRFGQWEGKEIEIRSSFKENSEYLSSQIEWKTQKRNDSFHEYLKESTKPNIEFIRAIINDLLSTLLKKDCQLATSPPDSHLPISAITSHIGVREYDIIEFLDLSELSLGESVLFNMMVSIIRQADAGDDTLQDPTTISGMVIIDEIDMHLHTRLQHDVLPKLIRMFPKIQFIITTHSPLFLLGMKETFKDDGFRIVSLPTGSKIGTEEFKEVQDVFDTLNIFAKFIEKTILNATKPIVMVEGKTDQQYIEKAAKVLNRDISHIDIHITEGNDPLFQLGKVLIKHPLDTQPIMLLFDPEDEKKVEELNQDLNGLDSSDPKRKKIRIEKMKAHHRDPKEYGLMKGIENLFPEPLIKRAYEAGQNPPNDGWFERITREEGKQTTTEFKIKKSNDRKQAVCDWICDNATPEDFTGFEDIFNMIEEFAPHDPRVGLA